MVGVMSILMPLVLMPSLLLMTLVLIMHGVVRVFVGMIVIVWMGHAGSV